jgi:hypothetical protein
MFGGKSIRVARYGLPGVVVGLALAWLLGAREPLVQAQQTGPEGQPLLDRPLPSQASVSTPVPNPIPRRLDTTAGRTSSPPRVAASGESSGIISLVVPSNNGAAQWLYIIDTKAHSFAIYKVDTANPKVAIKLEAARQYQWDLKLDNYNNSGLAPAAIENLVKSVAQQAKH